MLEGYQLFKDGADTLVLLSDDVLAFLGAEKRNDKQHVNKIGQILGKLAEFGLQFVNNTEQFRREGKFSTGGKESKEIAVYAVKAHQIRVYGGFLNLNGRRTFLGVEAARKRKNKADQAQLKRVAVALGENDG